MPYNKNSHSSILFTPKLTSLSQKSSSIIAPRQSSPIDTSILITTIILTMIGLVMVYSVTINSGFVFLKGQIIRICIGLCALTIASMIPYKWYQGRVKDILLIGTIILLILTLTIGRKVAFARRWALFFQTAEIAKYSLIIWLSGYYANIREKQNTGEINQIKLKKFPYIPLIIVGLIIMLLLFQPAVGTSAILALSALFVFYVSGVKLKNILLIGIISIAVFSLSIITIPYAKMRYDDFRKGMTYQQWQSRIAIGSGGVKGVGLGEGKQKLHFLPEVHTDFIYSAIGEEFGLIGSFVILSLFFILFSRGFKIGIEVNDIFGQYLVIGICVIIFQYVLVHLGVALALIPTTGQPLPFVSYGGTALVTNLYAVGIILNVSKFRRKKLENNSYSNRWNRRAYLSRTRGR